MLVPLGRWLVRYVLAHLLDPMGPCVYIIATGVAVRPPRRAGVFASRRSTQGIATTSITTAATITTSFSFLLTQAFITLLVPALSSAYVPAIAPTRTSPQPDRCSPLPHPSSQPSPFPLRHASAPVPAITSSLTLDLITGGHGGPGPCSTYMVHARLTNISS